MTVYFSSSVVDCLFQQSLAVFVRPFALMKDHVQHQFWKDQKISAKLEDGWSYRAIADDLSVSFTRISSIASKKDPPHQRGRPPKCTDEIRKFIETNTQLNARLTNEKMAQMIQQQFGTKLDRVSGSDAQ